jgi:hypothetical protein
MGWRKVLGLAGFAGVAATGVVIVRAERRRRAYTSPEIRERLHARLAESSAAPSSAAPLSAAAPLTSALTAAGEPASGRMADLPPISWLRKSQRRWRERT